MGKKGEMGEEGEEDDIGREGKRMKDWGGIEKRIVKKMNRR